MPWKEIAVPDERMRFVLACLDKEDSMAGLCRRFGVSRLVGYKWLSRYRQGGTPGLADQSRAPHAHPNRVEAEVERRYPGVRGSRTRPWGPAQAAAAVASGWRSEGVELDRPAAARSGICAKAAAAWVVSRRRRRGSGAAGCGGAVPGAAGGPNRCGTRIQAAGSARSTAHAATSDASSTLQRYCALPGGRGHGHLAASRLFEGAFREYGLPYAILTDTRSFARWARGAQPPDGVVDPPGHRPPADRAGKAAAERQPRADARHAQAPDRQPAGADAAGAAGPLRRLPRRVQRRAPARGADRHGDAGVGVPALAAGVRSRVPEIQYPAGHLLRRVTNGQVRLDWDNCSWEGGVGAGYGDRAAPLQQTRRRARVGPPRTGVGPLLVAWFGPIELGAADERRGRVLSARASGRTPDHDRGETAAEKPHEEQGVYLCARSKVLPMLPALTEVKGEYARRSHRAAIVQRAAAHLQRPARWDRARGLCRCARPCVAALAGRACGGRCRGDLVLDRPRAGPGAFADQVSYWGHCRTQ